MPPGTEDWSAEYQYRPAKDWLKALEERRRNDSWGSRIVEVVERMREVDKTRPRDFRPGDRITVDVYDKWTGMLKDAIREGVVEQTDETYVWFAGIWVDRRQMDVKEIIYAAP